MVRGLLVVLLHLSVTERFTARAPGLTAVTRRTLRTNLRFLARAGLIRADLRSVRGTDITARSGGVIVTVGGRRPCVVTAGPLPPPLLASAWFAGTSLVTGGTDPVRHNVTSPLSTALATPAGYQPTAGHLVPIFQHCAFPSLVPALAPSPGHERPCG